MTRTLLLWLPATATIESGDAPHPAWLRIDDGVIVDSGQDDGWVDAWERPQDDRGDERLIALAPAAASAPISPGFAEQRRRCWAVGVAILTMLVEWREGVRSRPRGQLTPSTIHDEMITVRR